MKSKNILGLFLVLSLFMFASFVSAANTVTLITPAANARANTTTQLLNATLDTNSLNLTIAEFFYTAAGVNTTIATVTNSTALNFNTTWDTSAIDDINNIVVWVNITNNTYTNDFTGSMDSSTGVDIDNGFPTATLTSSSIQSVYTAASDDYFTFGLNADNTIGISSCLAYFTDVETSAVSSYSISASGNACSSTSLVPATIGLTKGQTYNSLIQATDGNGNQTNSSVRILKVASLGGTAQQQTVTVSGASEEGNWYDFIINFPSYFMEGWNTIKLFFTNLF